MADAVEMAGQDRVGIAAAEAAGKERRKSAGRIEVEMVVAEVAVEEKASATAASQVVGRIAEGRVDRPVDRAVAAASTGPVAGRIASDRLAALEVRHCVACPKAAEAPAGLAPAG